MSSISTETGANSTQKRVKQLRLNTIKNCRRTLGRLAKEFHGLPMTLDVDVARFRALVYSIRTIADLFNAELQSDLVGRLEQIDRRIDELKRNGQ